MLKGADGRRTGRGCNEIQPASVTSGVSQLPGTQRCQTQDPEVSAGNPEVRAVYVKQKSWEFSKPKDLQMSPDFACCLLDIDKAVPGQQGHESPACEQVDIVV